MELSGKRFPKDFVKALRGYGLMLLIAALAAGGGTTAGAQQAGPAKPAGPDLDFPTVLYGAAYYNEYMPGDQTASTRTWP